MYIADTLSRAYMSDQSDMNNDDDEAVLRIMSATVQLPATKQRLQEIRKAPESDETLKKVEDQDSNKSQDSPSPYFCKTWDTRQIDRR
ncbi:hypothetical protein PoB_004562800 [Plakobranchus ocellatus]|uniref:Uncharacterized protein n=1 Tax=Plakobranchus ocellatus TaxID=259542 RepID=A0AAV4BK18_9GAST|nr:hypothetical protein PoB_004562800 [Plakobranchus ocellatus]